MFLTETNKAYEDFVLRFSAFTNVMLPDDLSIVNTPSRSLSVITKNRYFERTRSFHVDHSGIVIGIILRDYYAFEIWYRYMMFKFIKDIILPAAKPYVMGCFNVLSLSYAVTCVTKSPWKNNWWTNLLRSNFSNANARNYTRKRSMHNRNRTVGQPWTVMSQPCCLSLLNKQTLKRADNMTLFQILTIIHTLNIIITLTNWLLKFFYPRQYPATIIITYRR